MAMKWKELNLAKADGHPAPKRLCVIRRRVKGFGVSGRMQYTVGYFFRDERDPESRKLWWRDGDNAVAMQNPARWKDHYTDIEWMDMDEEVKRNE